MNTNRTKGCNDTSETLNDHPSNSPQPSSVSTPQFLETSPLPLGDLLTVTLGQWEAGGRLEKHDGYLYTISWPKKTTRRIDFKIWRSTKVKKIIPFFHEKFLFTWNFSKYILTRNIRFQNHQWKSLPWNHFPNPEKWLVKQLNSCTYIQWCSEPKTFNLFVIIILNVMKPPTNPNFRRHHKFKHSFIYFALGFFHDI